MEIKIRSKENVIILDLAGKVDVNAANFVETVGQCLRDGYTDILCNFEEVESIDYLGISALVLAYKEVMNCSGRMRFLNMALHLKNMLSVVGLERVIEVFANEEAAISSFKEDKNIESIKKMQLRRRFKRLPLDVKIELKEKFTKEAHREEAEIVNLSAIGAYIFGCAKFKLGDILIIRFNLGPHHEEFALDAKVVWLPDRQVQPHMYPGMGVEFHHIGPEIQEKIVEFIDRNASLLSNEDSAS